MTTTTEGRGEQPWVRLAVWRRRSRRLLLVALALTVLGGVVRRFLTDGPSSPLAVVSVAVLAAAGVAGWWWVERHAGVDPRRLWAEHRGATGSTTDRCEDLDEAWAEYSLRHHLSIPDGSRHRVEALARQRVRDARAGLVVGPVVAVLGVAFLLGGGYGDGRAPGPLAFLWLVLGVVTAVRSVWRGRAARRWLRDPPGEVGATA